MLITRFRSIVLPRNRARANDTLQSSRATDRMLQVFVCVSVCSLYEYVCICISLMYI